MPALIGRDLPAAIVRGALERARGGHGGLVLIAGEAGIGKSALAADAADAARRTGALVAGGACWDRDGAPGYWPWTQVVRSLRRKAAPEEWTAATQAAGLLCPHCSASRAGGRLILARGPGLRRSSRCTTR
ncbi:AAA family ATPase [Nonomuraea sp. 10N515B]|uniref:AAA family ATPase n=1 Tax=Nonomuraea sp. 10N515B TaxID=3457422 RepID=UPI003FCC9387